MDKGYLTKKEIQKELEERLIMPDATTIFDLKEEDLKNFMQTTNNLFYDKSFDILHKGAGSNRWYFLEGNPFKFKKVSPLIEGKGFNLRMISRDYTNDDSIYLKCRPKFAFLMDRTGSPFIGLYLSQGVDDLNPWAARMESIYVMEKEEASED